MDSLALRPTPPHTQSGDTKPVVPSHSRGGSKGHACTPAAIMELRSSHWNPGCTCCFSLLNDPVVIHLLSFLDPIMDLPSMVLVSTRFAYVVNTHAAILYANIRHTVTPDTTLPVLAALALRAPMISSLTLPMLRPHSKLASVLAVCDAPAPPPGVPLLSARPRAIAWSMPLLTALDLRRSTLPPSVLAHIVSCAPNLETVVLDGATVNGTVLEALSSLHHLSKLSLRGCRTLNPPDLHRLRAPSLRFLDVSSCGRAVVPDALLGAVSASPGLVVLHAKGVMLGDAHLAALADVAPHLAVLSCGSANPFVPPRAAPTLTAAGLAALPSTMRRLAITGGGPGLTDAATAAVVAALPDLCSLDLSGHVELGDAVAAALASACPNLDCVRLFRCLALTDTGLDAVLALPHISSLDVDGCSGLSQDGVRRFEAAGLRKAVCALCRGCHV